MEAAINAAVAALLIVRDLDNLRKIIVEVHGGRADRDGEVLAS
jgi:hypothetical protein